MSILRATSRILAPALFALLLLAPAPARGAEYYFMTVFGCQRPIINDPHYTHSWAIFMRLTGEGPCLERYRIDYHWISWMPADLQLKLYRLEPERGANLDPHQTMRWCLSTGQRVSQWGPFQIRPELYYASMERVRQLESGQVGYRATDIIYRPDAANCIYAILDMFPHLPLQVTTFGFGQKASFLIVRRLRDYIIDEDTTYPWLNDRLGLSCYPIVHRRGPVALLQARR